MAPAAPLTTATHSDCPLGSTTQDHQASRREALAAGSVVLAGLFAASPAQAFLGIGEDREAAYTTETVRVRVRVCVRSALCEAVGWLLAACVCTCLRCARRASIFITALVPLHPPCVCIHTQGAILGKVNVVLALDKDDPAKEDEVKAVSGVECCLLLEWSAVCCFVACVPQKSLAFALG
jgi:hypothetical protein